MMEGVSHISRRSLKAPATALPVFDLGLVPYVPVQELQRRLRTAVAEGRLSGVLLILEHEPVITFGSRAGVQDLRGCAASQGAAAGHTGDASEGDATCHTSAADIPVVISERGGQATLHAPGQLVSYPVVTIPGRDLGDYVRALEEANILLLAEFGIRGERRPGRPGVYVDGDKISSVGLRCQRWVSSHGTSLNVSIDLSLFDALVSCGEPGMRQTSIQQLTGVLPDMAAVKELYLRSVKQVFGWELLPVRQVRFEDFETEFGIEG